MKNIKFTFNIVILVLANSILCSKFIDITGDENYFHISNQRLRLLDVGCTPELCPPKQGYCRFDKCICLEGFITVDTPSDFKFCNYEQKQSIVALLLESFGLFGIGHIYAGRILYGIFKLVSFAILICFGSLCVINFFKYQVDTQAAYYVKVAIWICVVGTPFAWHFIDLYRWANNQYLDGENQPMMNW